ncbi:diguanylate cyclase (GGDEF)-like protein [Caldicoprobacter guelmensis]|uniref:GGDEF domain-containing protein n=1 Tax=Caldicoprobacter guelmensis TaxID=1170224 RepID=UPI00195B90A0|nr:GGDEF domain-containing protein [Caldicoprobacter guelmensis]MBM7582325.1 diguanylate cyclase (GGDEF)-like protein [Caldicoprobacter guelmensis]
MITTVSSIMEKDLITIESMDSVDNARRIMTQYRIGCLPVMEGGRLVGIITTWDIMSSHPDALVVDAMTAPPIYVEPTASLWEAKEKMDRYGIERVLVVKDGQLLGLVTKTRLYFEIAKHFDMLTQLNKKDYILYEGVKLLKSGQEVSVIFIDIDGFGIIDKEYGHVFGDLILKEISDLLKAKVPDDCFLCRYGGDEFVVLTPYRQERCIELAKELLKVISQNEYSIKVSITASAGISGGRREKSRFSGNYVDDIENLINLASLASTSAKRNKVPLMIAEGFIPSKM